MSTPPAFENDLTMVRDYLRVKGLEIGKLAKRGDKEAIKLMFTYKTWFDHKLDVKLQNELIAIVKAYIHRDVTETERAELLSRYGHKVE